MFPTSLLIHVVRDGRDVVASLLEQDWAWRDDHGKRVASPADSTIDAAAYWRDTVGAARVAARGTGGSVLEVRYEALVRDPEAVMQDALAFVGEPWHPDVLTPQRSSNLLCDEASAEQVRQPITTASTGRFRRDLSPGQQAEVAAVAGEILAELGDD